MGREEEYTKSPAGFDENAVVERARLGGQAKLGGEDGKLIPCDLSYKCS